MLRFKSIEIEGFGSMVTKTLFQLEQPGLNIIRGKVGSGKTTIPAALVWGLYGQHLKGNKSSVTTWQELRVERFQGTKVKIIAERDGKVYEVIRCKDYRGQFRVGGTKVKGGNKLILLEDGQSVHDKKGKVALQKAINNLLGYSFELFKNSIIFGQKMKRIIEETGPNKKKVFEEAFEATFIKNAADNTLEQLNKLKQFRDDSASKLENLEDKLLLKEDNLKELEKVLENSKNIQKNYEENIARLKKETNDITALVFTNLDEFSANVKKLKSKIAKHREYNSDIKSAKKNLSNIEEGIEELEEMLGKPGRKCPTCRSVLQPDSFERMQKKLQKELDKLIENRKEFEKLAIRKTKNVEKLEDELNKLNHTLGSITEHNKQVKKHLDSLPKLKAELKKLTKEYEELDFKKYKKKIKKHKKWIKSTKATVKQHKVELKKLDRSMEIKEWLLKDPLSNNGLKVYLFNELLNDVNEQLIKYSEILGFRVEFGIDLSTRNKDFYQLIAVDNIIIPYEDLSGGQRQLVDTSVAFAIHDVVTKIKPSNIVFLDEPFESLGNDEIETIAELVAEKSKGKSLYLITHHQSFSPSNANIIRVSLDENKRTKIL